MVVQMKAEVLYSCHLNAEDARKVIKKAKELANNYYDDESKYKQCLNEAVESLYFDDDELESLYNDSTESDFSTESCEGVREEEEEA